MKHFTKKQMHKEKHIKLDIKLKFKKKKNTDSKEVWMLAVGLCDIFYVKRNCDLNLKNLTQQNYYEY